MFIKAGSFLIPVDTIKEVDIYEIENGWLTVKTDKSSYVISGLDALEAVYILKPSSLEGKRLKWKKHSWAFHNLIGHPVVQILAFLGLKKQAVRFHDWSTPIPRGFKNKVQ